MKCSVCGKNVGDFTNYPFEYVYENLAFCSVGCVREFKASKIVDGYKQWVEANLVEGATWEDYLAEK